MANKNGVFKELVKHSTQRISTTYTLFLAILEEKIAYGRGHSTSTDSPLVDQGSRQHRLSASGARRDPEKS